MKKNWFKKALCVGLAAAMTAGLCACGGGSKVAQDPSLAKQYVYSLEEFELPDFGEDFGISEMAKVGERIYLVVRIYNWNEDGRGEDVKLLSFNTDGTDMQEVAMTMPEKKSADDAGSESGVGEPAGEPDAAEPTEEPDAAEPGAEEVPGEEPTEEPDTIEPVDDADIGIAEDFSQDMWEYTSYSRYSFSESGILYAIKSYSIEGNINPDTYMWRNEVSVCAWDLEGNLLFELPIERLTDDSESDNSVSLQAAVVAGDGFLLMAYDWASDDLFQLAVDSEGNLKEQSLEDEEGIFENLSTAYAGKDGKIYFFYYNEEDNYNTYIATYDQKSDSFVGESVMLPGSMYYVGYQEAVPGIDTDLLFSTSEGIYSYNIGDEDVTQIMSFVNSDLDTSNMYAFLPLDEDRIMGFYYSRMDYEDVGGIFTRVNPEDIPDKQVIVIAGESLNYDLMHRVVQFNRANDKYRIVTKTYESYAQPDDYYAGYTQLNADILAGNMPDILYVDYNTDINKYISKGLLADVGKLIENDEELSQTAFMENVFDAYRRNGKLYQVIPAFSVSTVVGKRSVVGDRTTWTMQDFIDLMASMPEGTQGFGEMTRGDFLNQAFYYCGKDFVDVEKGKCNFDSENFIAVLEYANTLPEVIDWESLDSNYWMSYETLYRTDQILLTSMQISDPESTVDVIGGTFGEDISYVGFPTDSGMGSYVSAQYSYVLSAKSANLDGAWEFIRYYLTEEYQQDIGWPLPTREDLCLERLARGMEKPYWEDEDGNREEYDYTYWMNGEILTLDPLSQEQYDQMVSFVRSVNKARYYNEDIWNIIVEEAEAFFTGQKTAKDVAGIIQNRAQIYVRENQ